MLSHTELLWVFKRGLCGIIEKEIESMLVDLGYATISEVNIQVNEGLQSSYLCS